MEPKAGSAVSLDDAIARRRSVRSFEAGLEAPLLMPLLRAGQGVTAADGKRAAPSAHALYPLALFVVAGAVEGLEGGLHRFDPSPPRLVRLSSGDLRAALSAAALEDQPWVGEAPAVIVLAADMARAVEAFAEQPPDGRRGVRYVYLEAGAIMQNICLKAAALGLGSVFVGGFDDASTAEVLELPEPYEAVGMICVGRSSADPKAQP